jgi:hypothetical protein
VARSEGEDAREFVLQPRRRTSAGRESLAGPEEAVRRHVGVGRTAAAGGRPARTRATAAGGRVRPPPGTDVDAEDHDGGDDEREDERQEAYVVHGRCLELVS